MVICAPFSVHATFPVTVPRITKRRMPLGTELGRLPLVAVTMTVSALDAQRPS
jgi:hypothetical protein